VAAALLLSVAAVAYNNTLNRWESFYGPAYVPFNLTFACAITLVAAAALELSRAALGINGVIVHAGVSLAAVVLFALGAFAFASSRHGHRIADERVAGMHGGALAYYVLIRIPLGTALTEEVVFRGMLFAAWSAVGLSILGAALCSSIAFGLWHIAPTVNGVRINDPYASERKVRAAVLGAMLLTTVAGLGLTWLRVETGGLLAPIVLHAGINSIGALAAVKACRSPPRLP
jgi:uncharacterized protein